MNRVCILLFLAVITLAACSTDDDVNCDGNPQAMNYLPSNDSSWWAYSRFMVDVNGNRQLIGRDTLWSIGEIESNGETYSQFIGSLEPYSGGVHTIFLMRDSSYHLVDGSGNIILPYLNFTDSFNHFYEGGELIWFSQLIADTVPTVVPAGTFTTVDFRASHFRQPTGNCPDSIGYRHNQFAENVGLVRSTYWYSSQGGCSYIERALESYHIE
jgi:hypothetical protein